jgi:anti-sigma factor RsiW
MTAIEHPFNPEALMEYLDGELPAEQAAAVQAHVATCTGCQRLSVELRGVSRNLAQWQVEDPPATFEAPSPSRSWKGSSRPQGRWFTFKPSNPSAAFAIAASGVVFVVAIGANLVSRYSLEPLPAGSSAFGGAQTAPRAGTSAPPLAAAEPGAATSAVAAKPRVAGPGQPSASPIEVPPSIARTARLRIRATDFETARPVVDRVVASTGGLVGRVDVSGSRGEVRTLTATLHIPAAQLDAAMATLKSIGRVVDEAQSGEDVTEQVVDVTARLANARHTEKRLTDLLQKRTGDLADVLAAEREIARVREAIERLDAQRQGLGRRVSYATLNLEIVEDPRATLNLGPRPLPGRFRDALVTGVTDATDTALGLMLLVIRVLPSLVLWGAVLYWPFRAALRWTQHLNVNPEP